MKHLRSLNKYFWKYRWLFLMGVIFIVLSNYFRILSPQLTKYVLNTVEHTLKGEIAKPTIRSSYDPLIHKYFIQKLESGNPSFKERILLSGIILLVLALISGF